MPYRVALHTWTLDTTPLARLLAVARRTGWDGVELRRLDFERAVEAGGSAEAVIEQVRASGLAVSCVGGVLGWMFADDDKAAQLLAQLDECCAWAAALGAGLVMSPADLGTGSPRLAAERLRRAGDLAARHGARLAIEPLSPAAQLSTLGQVRELLALADHPACGLLVDTYHVERGEGGLQPYHDLAASEIAYVQCSDVPAGSFEPGQTLNRLPPGQGVVPFREIFALLAARGYAGFVSYEAPNPATWSRDPEAVAREGLAAVRAFTG